MTNGYNGRHIKENAFYIIPASDSIIPKNNNIIHMNKVKNNEQCIFTSLI